MKRNLNEERKYIPRNRISANIDQRKREYYIHSQTYRDNITTTKEVHLRNLLQAQDTKDQIIMNNFKRPDGTCISNEDETITELFNKYFPEDREMDDTEEQNRTRNTNLVEDASRDANITIEEVRMVAENIKTKKATTKEGITNEIVKKLVDKDTEQVTKVFNNCLVQGVFPRIWKIGEVVWLSKKDGGLRPILLQSSIGKLLDKILSERIAFIMEKHGRFNAR